MEKTITGTLPHGFEYSGKLHKDYEMREVASAGELFDAEIEAEGAHNQLAFNAAVAARQLVRIGDCEGPFTLQQIRTFKPADFQELRVAQGKLSESSKKDDKTESESGTK